MKDETRKVEHFSVRCYQIIGTNLWVYRVWEPAKNYGAHSTVTHLDDQLHGDVAARSIPKWMDELPRGDERIRQVREFRLAQEERAYEMIVRAFPEAVNGRRSMGQIEIRVG